MKKNLSVLILVMLIFTSVFSISTLTLSASTAGETYYGLETYKNLHNNINFIDINDHWAKPSIIRSSSLSIMKGMGNNRFYPNDTLTKEQAVILLTRLMGLEESAQRAGEALENDDDTGDYIILDHSNYWAMGYIQTALNENILTQEEIDKITSFTYNEEQQIEIEVENLYDNYYYDYNLNNDQLENIYDQLVQKIEYKYSWKTPVNREQAAVWVYRTLGLNPIYGSDQNKVYSLKDYEKIDTKNIPIIEAVLQRGIMSGDTQGFFNPNSSITRGEMARLLDNISDDLLLDTGFKIGIGVVEKITNQDISDEGIVFSQTQFIIKNDDNSLTNIITQKSTNPLYEKGFVAIKEEKSVLPEDIKNGDYIRYYISPDNKAVFVEVLYKPQYVKEGFVEEIDEVNNTILISDYDDNKITYKISDGVDIKVNSRVAGLSDLLYGMEVSLGIDNGSVVYIKGYLDEGEDGYIPPGGRIQFGKVLEIDTNNNIIKILENGEKLKFPISVDTLLMKNNDTVKLNSIMEGDMIRLEFDTYNVNTPSKVYISSPSKQIERLLKAKLNRFNPMKNEMLLTDVSHYEYSDWKEELGDMKINLSSDAEIYIDGIKISMEDLNNHTGKELYIATNNRYSREEVVRALFKTDFERNYYNRLQKITYGDNKLRVDYINMLYNDSTIIVKDDRLIHPYNLRLHEELFVITQGNNNVASFISVEAPNPMNVVIYRGLVEEIYQYSFDLEDVNRLTDNKWTSLKRVKDLQLSEETTIIDTRDDDIKIFGVDKFTNSRFFQDNIYIHPDHRDDNYKGEFVYAVEYDNMILTINIVEDSYEEEVISSAKVESIDLEMNTIKMKELKDWSDFRRKWNINTAEIDLEVENSLIIKNGKRAKIDDLLPDDNLYVIRNDSMGYIVIAE